MNGEETKELIAHGKTIATLTAEIKNLHQWMKDDFAKFEKFINGCQGRHSGVNTEIANLKTEIKIIKEKDSPRALLVTAIVVGLLNVGGFLFLFIKLSV